MSAESDFDVNILEDALTHPNIDLTFPLPTDKDTHLPLETSEKISTSFQILEHFIGFFTKINAFEIYKNADRFSVNKSSKEFSRLSNDFMNDRLEKSDEKLDEIVYNLIDSELRMNLINAKDFPKRFKEVKEFMIKYYKNENAKNLPKFGSATFIRLCYITVIKTVTKMFPQGVWANRKQFSDLYRKYLDDPMSIAFLPNHQSHIDYVIMHLILIRFQMSVPAVISGDNLNVAVFGSIMKGLGGIFIKRSFNNEMYTERNLTNYVEFIFMNKIHFEVFIEGARSRDGKLLLPKYGILKTLASVYQKQKQEKKSKFDLLVQPVSITYERTYEADGYLNELIGMDKKQESFMNILSNGLSNIFSSGNSSKVTYSSDGYVDNTKSQLNGKIYVQLADNFTFSSFANDRKNLLEDLKQEEANSAAQTINLKKLGFRILHSMNEVSYLPECAIVGTTIQTFYYLHGRKEFLIKELIPMMDFITDVLQQEVSSATNKNLLVGIKALPEAEKVALIESQIIKFFRFTKVNPNSKSIKIVNTFELLYYKNLAIHLIIHKCLVSLILLRTQSLSQINKLYYILTGFLKNEFLFDHDYNKRHELSRILRDYQESNLISSDYEIKDISFHKTLATIIQPFVDSFSICVDSLIYSNSLFGSNSQNIISEKQLINDKLLSKHYPTTKSVLKLIQKDNLKNFENDSAEYHVETYNKQYLLSFLFYLNNLKLVRILKNKAKTNAYVVIIRPKDLHFISTFMQKFNGNTVDELSINYMIDIVDKSFERIPPNGFVKLESKL